MNNKKLERIASESSMFPYSLPIACFLLLIFLASCSIQKKIAHSASDIIHDPSLQTAHIGISIYEPGTNKYWYEYNGDKYFVPASNTKIPTCYAAMKYLGDSLIGLRYKIKEDNLVEIVPAGDPTFLHPDFKNQPVFRFLRQFKSISILNPLYSDFLGSGWSWNDYKEDYMAQRSSFPIYGNVVKFRWSSEDNIIIEPQIFHASTTVMEKLKTGFEIVKPWDENKFLFMNGSEKNKAVPFRPDILTIVGLLKDTTRLKVDADILGNTANLQELHSQPTDSLLKPMMHRSDNFFAEQSLLMVSNEKLGVMNDEMIIDTLLKTDLKDLPQ
jgi:D-alanyl-D-alanine carboxypeptidase/D-alanyl-D-alanine-endopeptidase (penicillin-binding protein 4)